MESADKDYRGGGPLTDVESKHNGESYPRDVNFAALNDPNDLVNSHDQLSRGLKSRHIQFLALGGAYVFRLFCTPSIGFK